MSDDTEYTWLIEAPGPHYLSTHVLGRQSEFTWVKDANAALRFYTVQQSDGVLYALRKLQPELFAFARNLGDPRSVQHGFMPRADEAA